VAKGVSWHYGLVFRGAAFGDRDEAGPYRDEYPPPESRQGGEGADVRDVPSADNRGAGTSQDNQLRPYCNGQRFGIATPRR